MVQLRLEDTIYIQKRTYTKISEIFSFIGGYMQLMNTVFMLISTIINKIYSEIKIVKSIFNFNVKENKLTLKLKSINDLGKKFNCEIYENSSKNTKENKDNSEYEKNEFKSRNDLIIKENNFPSISFINISNNNNINKIKNYSLRKTNNHLFSEDLKKTKCEAFQIGKNLKYNNFIKINSDINNKNYKKNKDFGDDINMNIFNYLCSRKNSKYYKTIKLFNNGSIFFRKKMDIVHVFILLSILENNIHIK